MTMVNNRILHILNAEGDGKEAVFVDGIQPQDYIQRNAALSDIVDFERQAAGKPSIWCGRIQGCYYASGIVIKDMRSMPFSYCSSASTRVAHSNLIDDLSTNGFSLDQQTQKDFSKLEVVSKAVIGLSLAAIVITSIILLCK